MHRQPADSSLNTLHASLCASAFALAFTFCHASGGAPVGGDSPQASAVLTAAPDAYSLHYGISADLSGDYAIVGDDAFGSTFQPGAAFIYRFDADTGRWLLQSALPTSPGANGDGFGWAVAIDGVNGIAVVGAPNDDSPLNNSGSAYVYRRVNSTWVFEQKLTASDAIANDYFGRAVAVQGSVIIIGSPQEDSGSASVGSAYVFRHNGSAWVQSQKLLSPDPAATNHFSFGSSVAMDAGVVVIGEYFGNPSSRGSAHVFTDNGTNTTLQQTIAPVGASSLAQFAWTVDVRGDLIVAGTPRDASNGSAYVFRRNAGVWAFEQRLLAGDGASNDDFGAAVTVDGEMIAVGARFEEPDGPSFNTGSVYCFTSNAGVWTQQRQFRACSPQSSDAFGYAVAASNGRLLASTFTGNFARKRAYIFEDQFPDCNSNGVTDVCEFISNDANFNGRLDSCEIADGSSGDCDNNGAPDEAQAAINYQLANPGFTGAVWGGGVNEYTLWLNHHQVTLGAETITALGFKWSWDPPGLPVTILIYDDPNNDGNPNDAVLLSSFNTTNDRGLVDVSGPQKTTFIPVPATDVGSVGDSFFVGAIMNAPVGQRLYPMAMDGTDPDQQRSWWAHGPAGTASLANLAMNPNPLAVYPNYDFYIAVIANDCNGNGVWDACDISAGVSLDLNANGVPDECEVVCPADLDHSGAVGVSDLLAVIAAWGATGGNPADVNGDGTVNVADLLAVITAWGPCS